MATYRVRAGHQFGAQKQHGAGALVELTPEEALGFLDKLEPVEAEEPAVAPPATAEPIQEADEAVEPTAEADEAPRPSKRPARQKK